MQHGNLCGHPSGKLQRSIKGITTAAVPVHVCDRVKSLPKCAKKKLLKYRINKLTYKL